MCMMHTEVYSLIQYDASARHTLLQLSNGQGKKYYFSMQRGVRKEQTSKITSSPHHQGKVWIRRSFLDQLSINPWSNTFPAPATKRLPFSRPKRVDKWAPPCLRLLHVARVLGFSVWYCLHVLVGILPSYVTRQPNKQPSAAHGDQGTSLTQTYWSHTPWALLLPGHQVEEC